NRYTNVWYAKRGYATVNASMRGQGDSCGNTQTRYASCARGWFHLGDQRYEARDVQTLLGRLVDEGIADSHALGTSGCSYGSLISIELALLRTRIRELEGRFAPWASPKGTPLSIRAAFTYCSISSLVSLALPNGRFLDDRTPALDLDRTPAGVAK